MEFIEWWLDKHYILSTLFTPGLTFLWCVWKGVVLRGIIALILYLMGHILVKT